MYAKTVHLCCFSFVNMLKGCATGHNILPLTEIMHFIDAVCVNLKSVRKKNTFIHRQLKNNVKKYNAIMSSNTLNKMC